MEEVEVKEVKEEEKGEEVVEEGEKKVEKGGRKWWRTWRWRSVTRCVGSERSTSSSWFSSVFYHTIEAN